MVKDDRVVMIQCEETERDWVRHIDFQDRGTVERVSSSGYTRILWDQLGYQHLTLDTAKRILRVVTGDDALPRHVWDVMNPEQDPPCIACGVIQSDDNEFEPCRGK